MGGSELDGGGSWTVPAHEHANCNEVILRLSHDNKRLEFIAGYLYDALGPANDDIWNMAEEAWDNITPEEKAAKYDIEYDSHESS